MTWMQEPGSAAAMPMKRWGVVFAVLATCGLASVIVVLTSRSFEYFPEGVLDPQRADLDTLKRGWYSSELRALNEPVLAPSAGQFVFRFTLLRSSRAPMAVRIVAEDGRYTLHALELFVYPADDQTKEMRRVSRVLSSQEVDELKSLIDETSFWDIQTFEKDDGVDGSRWIIEGATDQYHVVDRWSPKSGPARKLGEYFLSLTGWQFSRWDVY